MTLPKRKAPKLCRAPLFLVFSFFFALPVSAEQFPEPLELKLTQGLEACLNYYETGKWPLTALEKHGFVTEKKEAIIDVILPNIRRRIYVKTVIEGTSDTECEVHTNYDSRNPRRDGFELIMDTSEAAGFTPKQRHRYSSSAKTVFVKGENSMFMKVRIRGSELMLKFKRRSMNS